MMHQNPRRGVPEQVAHFGQALFEPDDLLELRALGAGPPVRDWVRAADLADQAPRLAELNGQGLGIFVGANPRRRRGGKAEDVALARSFVADLDGGVTAAEALRRADEAALPGPTVVVESGHGVHLWWRLGESMEDLDAWSQHQRALAAALEADRSVVDPPRVMRVPGFRNLKRPAADAVLSGSWPDRVWSLEEFPAVASDMRLPGDSHETLNADDASVDPALRPAVEQAIRNTVVSKPDQRRRRLFQLVRALQALGFTSAADAEPVVREWWRRGHQFMNHPQLDVSLADLHLGWDYVRVPLGDQPLLRAYRAATLNPPIADPSLSPAARNLWGLCLELARRSKGNVFWLQQEAVAPVVGLGTQRTVSFWLRHFRERGWLEKQAGGHTGRATEYEVTEDGWATTEGESS